MATAISVEHVSKAYRLGTIGSSTLGADLVRWWASFLGRPDPMSRVGQEHRTRRDGDVFWALDDVGFTVQPGEVVGLIGRNGAGKSTLLKILAQVTAPSDGSISYRGRIASLLEVGTGFHPELTGRENIFLNGAILGMRLPEIRRKFDEIVAFSECEQFLDTPVKRYSSGMYVRLAFAVAAHLDPDILVVDEVLAVGDAQFQRKCLGKIRDVSGLGRTVLFVSHSMSAVAALCTRGILLKDGKVVMDGDVGTVIAGYQSQSPQTNEQRIDLSKMKRNGNGKAHFTTISFVPVGQDNTPLDAAKPGCDILVETTIECYDDFLDANVALIFWDAMGYRVVDVNSALGGEFLSMSRDQLVTVRFRLTDLLLKPGDYAVGVWLGRGGIDCIDSIEGVGVLSIKEDIGSQRHSEIFPGIYQCRFKHEFIFDR